MKPPDMLGIDIDDGVAHMLEVATILRTIGIDCRIYITTRDSERSHFHVETGYPTSLILRRFLGDDSERMAWAVARACWNGRPPDFLGTANRKRFMLQIPIGV